MVDNTNMGCKPVQVSIEETLLTQIDADPESRQHGRSAFIRSAIRLYLRAKERQRIDQAIAAAYEGKAEELLEDVGQMMEAQAWPKAK